MEHSPKFNSRELRVFKVYFSKLVAVDFVTDPVYLAAGLHSQDVISVGDLTEVMNTDAMTLGIAKLLVTVERQILVKPASLYKFLSVMRTDPSFADITDRIADECRKCAHTIVMNSIPAACMGILMVV